jgi:acetyltransferase-like isoleucine patch superfamily enzyme
MGGAMCAALRRSGADRARQRERERAAFLVDPDAVAPPSALPRDAGLRDRWRARGLAAGRDVVIGRGVVVDGDGAAVVLGDGVALGDGCRFHVAPGARVAIGAGTRLGERCVITAHGSVTIGARCLLADEVVLIDATARTDDVERPLRRQGLTAAPITVGDDVRIGPSAALGPGTAIASGATVAAHAVLPAP